MQKRIKKWSIRLVAFISISFLSIVFAIFNPSLLYANKTISGDYTIYHNAELPAEFQNRLSNVKALVKQSELYNENFKPRLCLNDGSFYPAIMETFRGPAFGWGFHNLAIFRGTFDFKENTVTLNGYDWNLEQLMTHEIVHCLQSYALGMIRTKPIKNHPNWKWEGYPEYVSRNSKDQLSLRENIKKFQLAKVSDPNEWGMFFDDGTVAPRSYNESRLLVQYCLEVKEMSYLELLDSKTPKASIEKEMNEWYNRTIVSY